MIGEPVSSAFAHVEGSAPAPQHASMSALEIYKGLSKLESKLDVLDQISGLSVAADAIHAGRLGGYYNIIVLDKIERSVSIGSFAKDELSEATKKYAELEAEADSTKDLVLVSAGKLRSLKLAYPNYFLDVRDFIEKVKILIEEADGVI
jgi:putative GTP pyrophosphokinase